MITKFKKKKKNGIPIFQIQRDKILSGNIILRFFKNSVMTSYVPMKTSSHVDCVT